MIINGGDNLTKETIKILRVAIYLRLSDEDRNKANANDDSESIKNQRNLLMGEVNKHEDWIIYDEYCDEDLSGAGTYRPEFERLIEDCENGKIDIVLCKSQSRFSRDMEVIEKYLHNKFIEWNVRFLSFTDNADTNNLGNKKSRQINGLVNEWYLEDLSNNIKAAFDVKMKNGEFISPFASYGYIVNPKNNNELIIDEEVKENVKEIFNLYLIGYGYQAIAKQLNERKIPCPSLYKHLKGYKLNVISSRNIEDIKWSHNAIKTILTNEIYIGNLIQGKRTTVSYKNKKIVKKSKNRWVRIQNAHEPIIDMNTWNGVQAKIMNNSRACTKTGMVHIFSGKVYCLECGHYLKKNCTQKHEYLVCTSTRNGYDDCINKLSIRFDFLENLILEEINKIFSKYYDIEKLKKGSLNSFKSNYQGKIDSLIKEKKLLMRKKENKEKYLKTLYKDRVDGIISVKEFTTLQADYLKSDDKFDELIDDIDKKIEVLKSKDSIKRNNQSIFEKYKKIDKLNKIIVDEFIDRIEIGSLNKETSGRNITIKWNFNI
ncbi:MAG: recombinase family protein [Bacilli bacterium]|nr:recombinase family protein [Bacilli bacterium]MDD4795868.1 recombinase family protein [Bacilli bacterium]